MFDGVVRFLMGLLFVLTGAGKAGAPGPTSEYMASFGLSEILLWPTIIFEIAGGVLLIIGFKTRLNAAVLAVFTIAASLVFHTDFSDQSQIILFLKNMAIVGGFLVVAKHGSENWSIDRLVSKKDDA